MLLVQKRVGKVFFLCPERLEATSGSSNIPPVPHCMQGIVGSSNSSNMHPTMVQPILLASTNIQPVQAIRSVLSRCLHPRLQNCPLLRCGLGTEWLPTTRMPQTACIVYRNKKCGKTVNSWIAQKRSCKTLVKKTGTYFTWMLYHFDAIL